MKPIILAVAAAAILILSPQTYGQETDVTAPAVSVDSVVTDVSVFADSDVSAHHVRTLEEVKKAIQASDDLRPLQKRRLIRRLNRPHVAERVTDMVTSNAMIAGYIQIAHGGLDSDDDSDVEVQADWDAIIEFIERLIPLIIKLIGLFG